MTHKTICCAFFYLLLLKPRCFNAEVYLPWCVNKPLLGGHRLKPAVLLFFFSCFNADLLRFPTPPFHFQVARAAVQSHFNTSSFLPYKGACALQLTPPVSPCAATLVAVDTKHQLLFPNPANKEDKDRNPTRIHPRTRGWPFVWDPAVPVRKETRR